MPPHYKRFENIGDILSTFNCVLSVGMVSFLLFWVAGKLSFHRRMPYPPGPPPNDFISGHARELSGIGLPVTLTNWAATYGPIVHLRSFNQHTIVLNSVDDAVEIMKKRSHNYSDRPYIPMLNLVGWDFSTGFQPYGPVWQAHRRLMQQMLRPAASLEYRPIQVEKVNDMLLCLLESPEEFMAHAKTLSASIIMSAMYGYQMSPKSDYFQELAEAGMTALSKLTFPGGAIVNVLPALRFLPAWFPGAGFHRVAKEAFETVSQMKDVPYKYVQDNMAAGTASPSFVADRIEGCKTEMEHTVLKEASASGYGAGADTTTSSICTFIYAMAKFPGVQKKAQEEVDRVIGHDRLVNFDDEDSLPYVQALCREVFRWRPVAPLGIFHVAVAEDVYQGYYIPKGTTIIPNIWAMSRDPSRYNNPEEFNPDRFFTKDGKTLNKDDVIYTFGFGRRICPGRHLASATVWLAVATILSAFDIRPPKDASGQDVSLDVEYNEGLISHPVPFDCIITPRSNKVKQLIIDLNNNSI